jgi:GNAT superfamily N-acetyltransferase
MRSCARVRVAEHRDVEALAQLADATAVPAARLKVHPDRRRRYAELVGLSDRVMLVAVDERTEQVVGVVVGVEGEVGALTAVPAMIVNHLVVDSTFRKRGVGRALLAGIVRNADERGIEQVVVSVSTGDRDANRYLARLGFTPLVVRRIASTNSLRRSLGMADVVDRADLRRRRGMRAVLPGRIVSRGA